ncbi:winged helix-turn-helix domain-containing protein [Aliikangiella sp. G2MR2-5]|uniref:winged helix-turn-helix domain-containing protein n=1 Tax=Aliikangiella sp. G2MR2-5 TaxID=2788943 RepID=UPI0018AB8F95|nr:winged helix-turn-helix domain-containing protein [Aliikangiella sp. G2MR2-5]
MDDMSLASVMNVNWKLDQWLLKPDSLELEKAKVSKKIEPKAMRLLCYLICKKNDVVSANTLVNDLWDGVTVSENSVRRLIAQIRKALDDDAGSPKYIETVSRRGYKLICSVQPAQICDIGLANLAPEPGRIKPNILAVVFFLAILCFAYFTGVDEVESNRKIFLEEEMTRLTSKPGEEVSPKATSDFSTVFYTHFAEHSDKPQIRAYDPRTSADYSINGFIGQPHALSWSSDGKRVAYIDFNTCQIYTALYSRDKKALESSIPVASCNSPFLTRIGIFNQGRELYINEPNNRTGKREFSSFNFEEKNKRPLALGGLLSQSGSDEHIIDLIPHEQLSQWLLLTRNSNKLNLWLLNPESRIKTKIFETSNKRASVTWCANSAQFLYSDTKRLFLYDDGINQLVGKSTTSEFSYLNCVKTEKGTTKILFSPLEHNISMITQSNPMIKISGENHLDYTFRSTQIDTNPMFSKTSKKLAFVSKRREKWQVWYDQDGAVKLASDYTFETPPYIISWSPDESNLLLLLEKQLFLLNFFTRKVSPIVIKDYKIGFASWGMNNNQILISETERKRIFSYNLDTKDISQLTHTPSEDMALSTDNKQLYFTRPKQKGLWKVDLATNEEKLIFPEFPVHSLFTSTPTGIYFHHHQNKEAGLYFYSFETKRTTTVLSQSYDHGHKFSISHDQSRLVYLSSDNPQADIRMIEITH